MTQCNCNRRRAISLIEVLVAISIVGMLLALLLPAVQAAREAGRRTQCQNNLHQLSVAADGFHTSQSRYPPGQLFGSFGSGPDSRAWSWLAQILPFIEHRDLYVLGHVRDGTLRKSVASSLAVNIYLCPTAASPGEGPRVDAGNLLGFPVGRSTYKAVSGANWGDDTSLWPGTVFSFATSWRNKGTNGSYDGLDNGDGIMFRSDYRSRRCKDMIHDGTSQTFLIGEDVPDENAWLSWPYANNAYGTCAIPPNLRPRSPGNWGETWGFRSRHPGGLQFVVADGSVRFVNDAIDLAVYRAIATIAGEEVLDDASWH
jgi:type II secretory pathway pseudopilin PulG